MMSEGLRGALEYLVGLGQVETFKFNEHEYTAKQIYMVKEPKPTEIVATTLTALVDYIKSNFDGKGGASLLIHVISPTKVALMSELKKDMERELYMECKALTPNVEFNSFSNTEKFNIMLQSSFVRNEDTEILLQVVGNIKDEAVKQTGDDGISQAVTIKTGVAQVQNVKVPNPVMLAPYRTFPEIEQPVSKFVFRMQSGPSAALFEADGGAWRNEAMNRIKKYLQKQLESKPNIKIIS